VCFVTSIIWINLVSMTTTFLKTFFYLFLFFNIFLKSYSQVNSQVTLLTPKSKSEIINSISQLLLDNYVYPDTAKLMSDYILKQFSGASYESIDSPIKLADVLNAGIKTIINDGHFQIIYNPILEKQLLDNNQVLPQNESKDNFRNHNSGIHSMKILNGNIGLLEMQNFVDTNSESLEAVKSALTFLSNTNAIIFDLRNNGGGSSEMVHFITSYFFEKKIHLCDRYSRPANRLTEYYTTPDTTEKRFLHKPVYILIGGSTGSAAEEFTYNLMALKRATIVGEHSSGIAHGTFERPATNGVVIYIPYSRTINAVTKTDWEYNGVTPDIKINSEKALEVALENIFEKLIKSTTRSTSLFELNWQYDLLKAANNPLTIDQESLRKFCGVFGERTFTLENGELYYQRLGKPKFKMTAMSNTKFKGNDFFMIEFIKNTEGNFDELTAYYQDQRIEKAKRTK
jgi:hypothetical protein